MGARFTWIVCGMLLLGCALGGEEQNAEEALTPLVREKRGKTRLHADLHQARQEKRPAWLKETELPLRITNQLEPMQKAVHDYFLHGEPKKALRVMYELIDWGMGKPKHWALRTLGEALIWAGEIPHAILVLQAQDTPEADLLLGRCYMEYDQYAKAYQAFHAAVIAKGTDHDRPVVIGHGHWGVGDTYRGRERWDDAAKAYGEAEASFEEAAKKVDVSGPYRAAQKKNAVRMQIMKELSKSGGKEPAFKDGRYTGMGYGHAGSMGVHVIVKDGRIDAVKLLSHRESMPGKALEVIPQRIIKQQTPCVDVVTGATDTSMGLIMGVHGALKRARK